VLFGFSLGIFFRKVVAQYTEKTFLVFVILREFFMILREMSTKEELLLSKQPIIGLVMDFLILDCWRE
jgi:hypothetical protein